MIPKNYPYLATDGNHFPDAALGSSQYYCINYLQWLTEEGDTLVGVEWELPEGLTGEDAHEAAGEAFIKLTPEFRRSYRVTCKVTTQENGKEQINTVTVILKVY